MIADGEAPQNLKKKTEYLVMQKMIVCYRSRHRQGEWLSALARYYWVYFIWKYTRWQIERSFPDTTANRAVEILYMQ